MRSFMKFFLISITLISTSIYFSSCKKAEEPLAKLATGQFDGIYTDFSVIVDSAYIHFYYDYDNYGNEVNKFLTGTVREDGSIYYKKTETIQGYSFTFQLDAFVTTEGKISGMIKKTAFGITDFTGVSSNEIPETRECVAGTYDGIYTGEVIDLWDYSSENDPFQVLVYGNVIKINSRLMGNVVGTIDSEGKFYLISNQTGFMSGTLLSDGIINGIFQFENGESADKFQFEGVKYQPEII